MVTKGGRWQQTEHDMLICGECEWCNDASCMARCMQHTIRLARCTLPLRLRPLPLGRCISGTHLACNTPTESLQTPRTQTPYRLSQQSLSKNKRGDGQRCVLRVARDPTLQFLALGPLRFGDALYRPLTPTRRHRPLTRSACPACIRFVLSISVRFGDQLGLPLLPIRPVHHTYPAAIHNNPPNTSHTNALTAPYPSIAQHLPRCKQLQIRRTPRPQTPLLRPILPSYSTCPDAFPIPSATFHPPAPSKNKRGGGFRKSVASRYLVLRPSTQCRGGTSLYQSGKTHESHGQNTRRDERHRHATHGLRHVVQLQPFADACKDGQRKGKAQRRRNGIGE